MQISEDCIFVKLDNHLPEELEHDMKCTVNIVNMKMECVGSPLIECKKMGENSIVLFIVQRVNIDMEIDWNDIRS